MPFSQVKEVITIGTVGVASSLGVEVGLEEVEMGLKEVQEIITIIVQISIGVSTIIGLIRNMSKKKE